MLCPFLGCITLSLQESGHGEFTETWHALETTSRAHSAIQIRLRTSFQVRILAMIPRGRLLLGCLAFVYLHLRYTTGACPSSVNHAGEKGKLPPPKKKKKHLRLNQSTCGGCATVRIAIHFKVKYKTRLFYSSECEKPSHVPVWAHF